MSKSILKLYLGFMLLTASQACAPASVTAPDPNAISTTIAGTSAAAMTQTAQLQVVNVVLGSPTVTRVPTWTPFPTYTVAVVAPRIFATVNTNCRKGPGKMYDRVDAVLAGEAVDIVGRSATADYWIIRTQNGNGFCWISAKYVNMTGVASILPVFTPPPLPTNTPKPVPTRTPRPKPSATSSTASVPTSPAPRASFTFAYSGMESCPAIGWWIEFQLYNNGDVTFQSISVSVSDLDTGEDLSISVDGFVNQNGCDTTDFYADLPPAGTRLVIAPVFAYNLTGHPLRTTINLCSGPTQSGTCVEQSTDITP